MTSDPAAPDEPAVPAGPAAPAATVAIVPAAPSVDAPATPDAPGARTPELSPAACGARLAELFPALFVGPDGQGTWRAIKLRIHADIQVRAPGQFSKRTLGIFFSRYTTTTPYLKALTAPGAQRFDLDGQPAGEIAEEHRTAAVEELERRRVIAAERRAAQRAQRAPTPVRRDEAATQPDAAHAAPKGTPRRAHTDTPGPDTRTARAPRPSAPAARRPPRPHDERMASPPSAPERAPSAALSSDPAQRERAQLLRAYEGSTLSKANFCALKRLTEAELDAALMQARAERA
jgi:sRNA-binding protein